MRKIIKAIETLPIVFSFVYSKNWICLVIKIHAGCLDVYLERFYLHAHHRYGPIDNKTLKTQYDYCINHIIVTPYLISSYASQLCHVACNNVLSKFIYFSVTEVVKLVFVSFLNKLVSFMLLISFLLRSPETTQIIQILRITYWCCAFKFTWVLSLALVYHYMLLTKLKLNNNIDYIIWNKVSSMIHFRVLYIYHI